MNKKMYLALFLIVGSLMIGGSWYWNNATIIADTTPPTINEAATTKGAIAYGNGKPTLLLFVDENIGIESTTVEIRTMGGFAGIGSVLMENMDMTFDKKMDSNTYKYKETMTQQLEQNTEYKVIYKTYDQSGLSDTFTTTIIMVVLNGKVTVNSIEVTGPDDTIYVNTLDLDIRVEITQAAESVASIYGLVNGKTLTFEKLTTSYLEPSSVPLDFWGATYTLPEDGSYSFLIQVLDTAGGDTRLASFNIELGAQYQIELMILVFGLVIAGALYFYFKRKDKAKNKKTKGTKGRRKK